MDRSKAFKVSPHIVSDSDSNGSSTIVMNPQSGFYFSLDEVGTHIWRKLERETKVEDLVQSIKANFTNTDSHSLTEEVSLFLKDLEKNKLISPAMP